MKGPRQADSNSISVRVSRRLNQAADDFRRSTFRPLRAAFSPGLGPLPTDIDVTMRLSILTARAGLCVSGLGVVLGLKDLRRQPRSYLTLAILVGQALADDHLWRGEGRRRELAGTLSPWLSLGAGFALPNVPGSGRYGFHSMWNQNHAIWAGVVAANTKERRTDLTDFVVAHGHLLWSIRSNPRAIHHAFGSVLCQLFLNSGVRILQDDAAEAADHLDRLAELRSAAERAAETESVISATIKPHRIRLVDAAKSLTAGPDQIRPEVSDDLRRLSFDLRIEMSELLTASESTTARRGQVPAAHGPTGDHRSEQWTSGAMRRLSRVAYGASAVWCASIIALAIRSGWITRRQGALATAAALTMNAEALLHSPAAEMGTRPAATRTVLHGLAALAMSRVVSGTKVERADGEAMGLRDNLMVQTAALSHSPTQILTTWLIAATNIPRELRRVPPQNKVAYVGYNLGYGIALPLGLNLMLRGAWAAGQRSDQRRDERIEAQRRAGVEMGRRAATYAIHHHLLQSVDLVLRSDMKRDDALRCIEESLTLLDEFLLDPVEYRPTRSSAQIVSEICAGYERFGLRPKLRAPLDLALAPPSAIALARGLNEGLANVLRHSRDDSPGLDLRGTRDRLVVTLSNVSVIPDQRGAGSGLPAARRAVAECGGTLDARQLADSFQLTFEVPLR